MRSQPYGESLEEPGEQEVKEAEVEEKEEVHFEQPDLVGMIKFLLLMLLSNDHLIIIQGAGGENVE